MDRLEQFKYERSFIDRHVSKPIDASRSKFEVTDREIAGYPIVWGERNDFDEIAVKGCTVNSLNARGVDATKNPIVLLNQHRQAEVLLRPTVLQEDDYGLYFEGRIIEGVQYADEALAQIKQGVLRQMSYGFNYIYDKLEYDQTEDVILLREIKLWEISLVTFSSGDSAQLRGYRDMQIQAILNKYTSEQINDIQTILSLHQRAVTNTHEENGEDLFTETLKLF